MVRVYGSVVEVDKPDGSLTPALLLDPAKLDANIARLNDRLARFPGVALRPHLKTAKCAEAARRATAGRSGAITVSTLAEAEHFLAAGFTDILYAVPVAPAKLARAEALAHAGAALTLLVDSVAAAEAVAASPHPFPTLVEIDVDGNRGGAKPDAPPLPKIAGALGGRLAGVLAHAGGSYAKRGPAALAVHAEQERAGAVAAAERLRAAGHACRTVSIGSTPTILFAEDLTGITEVRPGVYMFMDLVMAGLGVCRPDDIAISVIASVIGHRPDGRVLVDAGWMALSRDRGTATHEVDQGYGLVVGTEDVIVAETNQEHGILARRDGGPLDPAAFPIGSLVGILPNHACATAAQHGRYHLPDGTIWERVSGW